MLGIAATLANCTIHPLPEDVTGVETYYIVRQIRCETRAEIIRLVEYWLSHNKDYPDAQRIGLEFESGIRPLSTFHYNLFKEPIRQLVKLFYDTGVAYNYSLTMTETNNLGTQVDILKPFTSSSASFGFLGSADRERQNIRTFTVTDTFSHLIRDVSDEYCTSRFLVQANYVYPIVGRIGMDRIIQDFIKLTLFGNLAGPDTDVKGPPTLVDSLQFTTTVSATATPKVIFSPINNLVRLADASLTGVVSRQDIHKVIVGLAIDPGGAREVGSVRNMLFGPLLTASPRTTTEAIAALAVNQVLTQQIFQPTVAVTPRVSVVPSPLALPVIAVPP
jgi:hypothetical protein